MAYFSTFLLHRLDEWCSSPASYAFDHTTAMLSPFVTCSQHYQWQMFAQSAFFGNQSISALCGLLVLWKYEKPKISEAEYKAEAKYFCSRCGLMAGSVLWLLAWSRLIDVNKVPMAKERSMENITRPLNKTYTDVTSLADSVHQMNSKINLVESH